jgi:hypothetical protein
MEGTNGSSGEWLSKGGNMPGGVGFDFQTPNLSADELAALHVSAVSGKFNSLVIAKNLVMDIKEFNRMNPAFDNILGSNGTYDLRLPEDKMQLFLSSKYQILNECVQVLLTDDAVSNNQMYYKSPYDTRYGYKKALKKKAKT